MAVTEEEPSMPEHEDTEQKQDPGTPPTTEERLQELIILLLQLFGAAPGAREHAAIAKLQQMHNALHGEVPEGEPPSERASQVNPMTDEQWEAHTTAKEEQDA